ncbi:MAG: DoxX family protein [Microbacteriaceae bacterium]|jgi:putative oxidoreductase|nr:DoxX family protein [Microbacteriaceae bacterium]HEV7955688.1 DoxX family membrane protein [Marisediminicola sp.]
MAVSTSAAIARTLLRVGIGAVLIAHGSQKLFGAFGGGGIEGTGKFFESVGIRPGKESAIAAGLGEAGGGASLALGLATPLGAAAAAATMGVAASQHVKQGFFNAEGGFEFPATLALASSVFIIVGPGPISIDRLLGYALTKPWMRVVAGALVVPAIAAVVLRQRRGTAADVGSAEPSGE